MDITEFSFQGRILDEGYYVTSTDLPGFRVFFHADQADKMLDIIRATFTEFFPVYQSAQARERANSMSFERLETPFQIGSKEEFEVLGHFEVA